VLVEHASYGLEALVINEYMLEVLLDGGLDAGWWEEIGSTVDILERYAGGLLLFFVYV